MKWKQVQIKLSGQNPCFVFSLALLPVSSPREEFLLCPSHSAFLFWIGDHELQEVLPSSFYVHNNKSWWIDYNLHEKVWSIFWHKVSHWGPGIRLLLMLTPLCAIPSSKSFPKYVGKVSSYLSFKVQEKMPFCTHCESIW